MLQQPMYQVHKGINSKSNRRLGMSGQQKPDRISLWYRYGIIPGHNVEARYCECYTSKVMDRENENHQMNLYRLLKYIVQTEFLKLKINPEKLKKGLFYIMGKSDSDLWEIK